MYLLSTFLAELVRACIYVLLARFAASRHPAVLVAIHYRYRLLARKDVVKDEHFVRRINQSWTTSRDPDLPCLCVNAPYGTQISCSILVPEGPCMLRSVRSAGASEQVLTFTGARAGSQHVN